MANRVTAAEVVEILEEASSSVTDKPLTPFIDLAHLVVEENLAAEGLTEARLKEIERWLSAHFYCILSPRANSESAGVSTSYEANSKAEGFQSTRYGLQACALDTTGTLMSFGTGKMKSTVKMYRLDTAG
jgi:hypothetical protein